MLIVFWTLGQTTGVRLSLCVDTLGLLLDSEFVMIFHGCLLRHCILMVCHTLFVFVTALYSYLLRHFIIFLRYSILMCYDTLFLLATLLYSCLLRYSIFICYATLFIFITTLYCLICYDTIVFVKNGLQNYFGGNNATQVVLLMFPSPPGTSIWYNDGVVHREMATCTEPNLPRNHHRPTPGAVTINIFRTIVFLWRG